VYMWASVLHAVWHRRKLLSAESGGAWGCRGIPTCMSRFWAEDGSGCGTGPAPLPLDSRGDISAHDQQVSGGRGIMAHTSSRGP